jgi:hypothetical protein
MIHRSTCRSSSAHCLHHNDTTHRPSLLSLPCSLSPSSPTSRSPRHRRRSSNGHGTCRCCSPTAPRRRRMRRRRSRPSDASRSRTSRTQSLAHSLKPQDSEWVISIRGKLAQAHAEKASCPWACISVYRAHKCLCDGDERVFTPPPRPSAYARWTATSGARCTTC